MRKDFCANAARWCVMTLALACVQVSVRADSLLPDNWEVTSFGEQSRREDMAFAFGIPLNHTK